MEQRGWAVKEPGSKNTFLLLILRPPPSSQRSPTSLTSDLVDKSIRLQLLKTCSRVVFLKKTLQKADFHSSFNSCTTDSNFGVELESSPGLCGSAAVPLPANEAPDNAAAVAAAAAAAVQFSGAPCCPSRRRTIHSWV